MDKFLGLSIEDWDIAWKCTLKMLGFLAQGIVEFVILVSILLLMFRFVKPFRRYVAKKLNLRLKEDTINGNK